MRWSPPQGRRRSAGEGVGFDVEGGQADAADGDRVACGEAADEIGRCADRDTRNSGVGGDAENGSRGFDESGEHSYRVTRSMGERRLDWICGVLFLRRCCPFGYGKFEFGMTLDVVGGERADDVDAKTIVAGIFKRGA